MQSASSNKLQDPMTTPTQPKFLSTEGGSELPPGAGIGRGASALSCPGLEVNGFQVGDIGA